MIKVITALQIRKRRTIHVRPFLFSISQSCTDEMKSCTTTVERFAAKQFSEIRNKLHFPSQEIVTTRDEVRTFIACRKKLIKMPWRTLAQTP